MNIHELSGEIKKTRCEGCGRTTICFEEGSITPISRQLAYEQWLCGECVHDN